MASMEYPLTTVVQKILNKNYGDAPGSEVVAGNYDGGQGVHWDNKSSAASKRFMVFSYQRDFGVLWGLHRDEGGIGQVAENVINENCKIDPRKSDQYIAKELTLVVIWDGMPESDGSLMNIGGYVTPYDWAVMFSYLLFKSAKESKKKPHVRMLILDLKSQEYGGCFGIKTLNVLRSQFPWIQVYRPVGEKLQRLAVWEEDADTRAILPIKYFGFESFISDIRELNRILPTFYDDDDESRLEYLETAIQLWASNLAKPGDRHTVANLIGPLILANGFKSKIRRNQIIKIITEVSPLRNALAQLVFATGLASLGGEQRGGLPALLQGSNKGRLGRRHGLKFILIDDQYPSGFHHILSVILFGDSYLPTSSCKIENEWSCSVPDYGGIKCYSNASDLLEILHQSIQITDWDMPRKLSLPDEGDILILDLRLWIDDRQKNDFFEALKKVCVHLGAKALCEIDASFKAAYDAACGDVENETTALALLPLLLSHYDSSLPIVLFSSTHQRTVIEMVAHRPNIITDFSKPLLGNYVHLREGGNFLNDLWGALDKAIQMHESRVIWERIIKLYSRAPSFYIEDHGRRKLFNRGVARDYPLDSANMRRLLGYYYRHYILRAAYYDFMSIPWEFIEGSLKIDEDGRFDVMDIGNIGGFPENGGGVLLKNLRHIKAHGELTKFLTALNQKNEELRLLAILEFLVFIDFLEQSSIEVSSPCGYHQNLSDALSADVDENLLKYSLTLICAIWGKVDKSFSQATKNIVLALRS